MRRFALAFVLAVSAQPALAGPGPFDLFKTVCLDTGIDLDAVKRAARAAGGVAGRSESAGGPWAQTILRWRFKDVAIEAGATHVPALPGAPPRDQTHCAITGAKLDADSLARLGRWAGVPREKGVLLYTFREKGGKHLPLPKAHDAYFAALESGHVWELMVEGGTVTLVHYLTP